MLSHTLTNSPTITRPSGRGRTLSTLSQLAQHAGLLVAVWYERYRQRRALAEMSDLMLKDIGLSRGDVYRETLKPFWRA